MRFEVITFDLGKKRKNQPYLRIRVNDSFFHIRLTLTEGIIEYV